MMRSKLDIPLRERERMGLKLKEYLWISKWTCKNNKNKIIITDDTALLLSHFCSQMIPWYTHRYV